MKILRLKEVMARTGKRKSSTYRDVEKGFLSPPVQIGARAVGWPDNEIDAVIAARIAGRTNDELRELVAALVEARKEVA